MDTLLTVFKNSIIMMSDRGHDMSQYNVVLDYNSSDDLKRYISFITTPENGYFAVKLKAFCITRKVAFSDRIAISYIVDDNLVIFVDIGEKLVSKDMISLAISLGTEYRLKNLIIVGPSVPSSPGKDAINLGKESFYIQFFKDEELFSNPMNYIWGPSKYIIFNEAETKLFFQENDKAPAQIPRKFTSDPIMKWLGVKANLIIKEISNSYIPNTLVKEYITYCYTADDKK